MFICTYTYPYSRGFWTRPCFYFLACRRQFGCQSNPIRSNRIHSVHRSYRFEHRSLIWCLYGRWSDKPCFSAFGMPNMAALARNSNSYLCQNPSKLMSPHNPLGAMPIQRIQLKIGFWLLAFRFQFAARSFVQVFVARTMLRKSDSEIMWRHRR